MGTIAIDDKRGTINSFYADVTLLPPLFGFVSSNSESFCSKRFLSVLKKRKKEKKRGKSINLIEKITSSRGFPSPSEAFSSRYFSRIRSSRDFLLFWRKMDSCSL